MNHSGSSGSDPTEGETTLRGLAPGQLIAGRFRLEKILGKGGMGIVWQARDESLGGKVRALKFLVEAVAQDEMAVAELKDEVARCQELSHPHIIRVHDLVEDHARGLVAVSMELAAGGTLNARRAHRPQRWFEPEELIAWVRQLCSALDYAHLRARVVHRDLKPANLLLDADDGIKVADFGIAHALSETFTRLTGGTTMDANGEGTGPTSGTPAYMSPQQATGRTPRPSDDIYALGATLYDLLTGKPPFTGPNHSAVLYQLLDQDTVPLPIAERRRDLQLIDAPVPPQWEAVIAACLAKSPEDRPRTAGEVIAALDQPASSATARGRSFVQPSAASAPSAQPSPPPSVGEENPPISGDGAAATVPSAAQSRRWVSGAVVAVVALVLLVVAPFTPWGPETVDHDPGVTRTEDSPAQLPATPAPVASIEVASAASEPPPVLTVENAALKDGAVGKTDPVRLHVATIYKESDDNSSITEITKIGFIDTSGKLVIQPQWEDGRGFTDGLAPVQQASKWGFIDTSGKLVIRPQWNSVGEFSEGLAGVYKDAKCGFIDTSGKLVIQPQWENAGSFSEGLARVKQNGKHGFIDSSGKVVIQPQWEGAEGFSEGLARVKRGGKWGFIDTTGKLVIQPQWEHALSFSEGLAVVKQGGKWGFIDTTGKLVIQAQWGDALPFSDGMAAVQQSRGVWGGKWGFIDTSGKLVIQMNWERAKGCFDGLAHVQQGGRWGLIDKQGNLVVPLGWDGTDIYQPTKGEPVYHSLFKQTAPETILVVWIGPDLKEIWRGKWPIGK